MELCESVWLREPAKLKGNWRSLMPEAKEIRVEVGCGKGKFTIETAKQHPEVLLIAIEKVPDALVLAMELAVRDGVRNVYFISEDAAELSEIFEQGEIDRLYLNFCDPWPRKKNAKRRLTHRTFLQRYAWILKPGSRIDFKTDNAKLFAFSLDEFRDCGWFSLQNITTNLHENGPVGIMTGYEERFYALGTPINRCEAVVTAIPPKPEPPQHYIPDEEETEDAE